MIDILSLDLVQISLKFIFVVSAFFYLAYTFIVFRQVQVMRNTLITSFSPVVNLIGLANLLLAVALFVGFLLFL